MILSIESSCDDSSIAVTEILSKKVIYHKKISQELDHSKYGGVVPELAARLHAVALPKILQETKPYFSKLKAIAVTNQPGLAVTLVEGVALAQALSISLDIPLIAVNHIEGHALSAIALQNKRDQGAKQRAGLNDDWSNSASKNIQLKNNFLKIDSLNEIRYPVLSIVVSGGHTQFIYFEEIKC